MTRYLRFLAALALVLCLFGPGRADTAAQLEIAPRWGTMWLSPRLSANWVMLEYTNSLTKESKDNNSTVVLDLPAGIRCLWAGQIKFEQTFDNNNNRTLLRLPNANLTKQRPEHRGHFLYLATTLRPGTIEKGRVWAEWKDGKSEVSEFDIRIIDSPPAAQPKKFMAGVAMWPYQTSNWPDFAKQFASLGFNHINFWHGVIHNTSEPSQSVRELVKQARANNIMVSIKTDGTWDLNTDGIIERVPDSQALFTNGSRGGRLGPCPSYRGPGFIDYVKSLARVAESGISFIHSDEELYPCGGFHGSCVCPRCEGRWKKWLPVYRPQLEFRSGRDVITNYKELPEHWRAWLWFKASLTTERYRIVKQELVKAVEKYGAKSSPCPMLSWWVGGAEDWSLEIGQHDARGLAETIDFVMPQLYYRYKIPPRDFRAIVRRQAWALDKRNSQTSIDSDDHFGYANEPGNLTAAVLETVFAGNTGYCMWYGPYMDTRQWVELAAANNVIAKYESVFLDGEETDLFRCYTPDPNAKPILKEKKLRGLYAPWSPDVCTSTWENDEQGLLLISDYRKEREPVWVERSRRYIGPMKLYDAFSDEEVAQLTEGQWDFRIHLEKSPVTLLYWNKK